MPSNADYEDFLSLYQDYTDTRAGASDLIGAFESLPVEWEDTDQELEGFIDFMEIFSFADLEPGHDKEYWDALVEAYQDYYGVTDEGIDWEALREAYGDRT